MWEITGYFKCDNCTAEFYEKDAVEKEHCEYSFPACPKCHSSCLTWNEGSLDIGDEENG